MKLGEWLYADAAYSWMILADATLNAGMTEKAEKYMADARECIKEDPDFPHRPRITEAWRDAVEGYNSRVKDYGNRGVQIQPIII